MYWHLSRILAVEKNSTFTCFREKEKIPDPLRIGFNPVGQAYVFGLQTAARTS